MELHFGGEAATSELLRLHFRRLAEVTVLQHRWNGLLLEEWNLVSALSIECVSCWCGAFRRFIFPHGN